MNTRATSNSSAASAGSSSASDPSSTVTTSIACAAYRNQFTLSSRSSTGMRSSAEWMSVAETSAGIVRMGKKPYATVPNASRSQWLSVKPGHASGTARAPGSVSATNDSIARQSGVSSDDRVPPCASPKTSSYSMSSPSIARTTGSICAGVWPGSRRQSTSRSTSAGMTLRLCEAVIIVGENVGASNARTTSPVISSSARRRSTMSAVGGSSPRTVRVNASTSCWTCCSGWYAAMRSISVAALTSALSAIDGIDACPERPLTRILNGRGELLRRRALVERRAAELDAVAAALVDGEVAAHGIRVRLAQPLEAEAVADLLVGGGGEDEVAGRPKALAHERGDATASAATWLFMSSAPRPQISPSRTSPENGGTDHSAGSARTTSVWPSSSSDGPLPVPRTRATRFARSGTRAYSSHSTPFASR